MIFKNSGVGVIIAGLGNPGTKYRLTRHNVGFMALDFISQSKREDIKRLKFKALTGTCNLGDERALLMMPQTYMNLSGEAIREAANFYKVSNENIIVIYDDVSLPVGAMRIREKGSAGGHNGIKSIISCLGTDVFPRIKIGVGAKAHPDMDLADHVLGSFDKAEQKVIFELFENVLKACELISKGQIKEAQNRFNS